MERLETKSRNNAEAITTFTDINFHAVVYLEENDLYRAKNVVKLQNSAVDVKRYSSLQPREVFVGGRTENFARHWSRKAECQEFKYVDVCSLYPYVNARSVSPLGHPDLILVATEQQNQHSKESDKRVTAKPFQASFSSPGNNTVCPVDFRFLNQEEQIFTLPPSFPHARQTELHGELMFSTSFLSRFCFTFVETQLLKEELFVPIKCEVLPPSDLHLPVLPFKFQSKLFFPLCRRCVEERSSTVDNRSIQLTSNKCIHSQLEESCIWGTFTTPEIKDALGNRYRILDVAEIWSWSRSKRSVSLFKNYINKFLKIKMEASGWPQSICSCPQDKEAEFEILCSHNIAYLKDLQKKEGIILDPLKASKNKGLRFFAKILLNSLWGYLGMRDNMPKTRYVNNYREVVDFFRSPTKCVTDASLFGDDLMLLQYQLIDDAADAPRKTNVILTAFTTSHARIILLNKMQLVKVPKNVLYCDTDSIMYVHDKERCELPDIPIGSSIGEMADELPHDVSIDKF